MLGKHGKSFFSMSLIIYLYGTLIGKCIIVGNIISKVFTGIEFLDNYYVWLILFFVVSGFLSFRDVGSTKLVQNIIAGVRFLSIGMMVIGAFTEIGEKGV